MPGCEIASVMFARARAGAVSRAIKKPRVRQPIRIAYPRNNE